MTSDLASGFDSFEDAEVDDDPGEEEEAEELPADAPRLLNATGYLQELVTAGKRTEGHTYTHDRHTHTRQTHTHTSELSPTHPSKARL